VALKVVEMAVIVAHRLSIPLLSVRYYIITVRSYPESYTVS